MTAPASITSVFSAAADTYDAGAEFQRMIAEKLASKIKALPLPAQPKLLEVGCGTGVLTRALADQIPATLKASWTITDIAAPMVARCERALGTALPGARFMVMDGTAPALAPGFDVICSSMALQWFEDPGRAIGRLSALLNRGGHLAFATLGLNTFEEWQAACALSGVAAPTRRFLSAEDFQKATPHGFNFRAEKAVFRRTYANGWEFLRRLRKIGAHRAVPEADPLPAGALRKVLRATDAPFTVSYDVIYGFINR
ncbi:MAG: methyltransferase domain-containing protein [Rhodospirillaceae bacterium]|nr:methyltransferase domain-containing protein [Rhodospirillaceae bacterium]